MLLRAARIAPCFAAECLEKGLARNGKEMVRCCVVDAYVQFCECVRHDCNVS